MSGILISQGPPSAVFFLPRKRIFQLFIQFYWPPISCSCSCVPISIKSFLKYFLEFIFYLLITIFFNSCILYVWYFCLHVMCECVGGGVHRSPKQSMLLTADLSVDPYFAIFPFMSSLRISLQQWLAEISIGLFILCSIYSAQLVQHYTATRITDLLIFYLHQRIQWFCWIDEWKQNQAVFVIFPSNFVFISFPAVNDHMTPPSLKAPVAFVFKALCFNI